MYIYICIYIYICLLRRCVGSRLRAVSFGSGVASSAHPRHLCLKQFGPVESTTVFDQVE